ncbi:glucose-6-phosphate dehydrogenase assembly protein OpcA [Amycolatopsis magusensis]|uniref:Glucose-6-phosphate dehydrogenase assembly protein OpcA n=1 Tax=Amycolatopsis magusensis TaxID=882444 RepID=A0ABS4Q0G5_9PSEU|nr:glucose-6-phosphate dehydrogenase assembly protein OpcA [Amycolatopsis magusensis]MBP2185155.1 glucose-6-phosphate dehydrogenase assembly protein OpcA [Amycolatopsis magusensis]
MIIDLPSTTTSQLNKKLVELRERGGAVALGRVLTLVIAADDDEHLEDAIDAANEASREHPSRVIVVAKGSKTAAPRIDGQIRVGGDAGASEVIVLRLYGALAANSQSAVVPLLLPDAPIVTWWPGAGPRNPAEDQLGELAQRRITDSAAEKNPIRALGTRSKAYTDGDTDLAWTRLTNWRAQLVSALDLPPYEKVLSATVTGEADSPSTELLAGWLAEYLKAPVKRVKSSSAQGILSVTLERRSGAIELTRPDGRVGTLTQPGQPARRIALQRRDNKDCLIEELRRLDPDEIYEAALHGLGKIAATSRKAPAKTTATDSAKTTVKDPASAPARRSAKDSPKAAAKEPGQPSAGSSAKESGKAPAKAAVKESTRSSTKASGSESGENAAENSGKESGKAPAGGSGKGTGKVSGRESGRAAKDPAKAKA